MPGPGTVIPRSARPFDAAVLGAVDGWGAQTAAVAVIDREGLVDSRGPLDRVLPWASVTKLVTACVVLVGVQRGALALDAPAGPPGSTVRHLLAHAGGYGFDGGVLAAPGRTRIYSNTGFDTLGEALGAATGRPFALAGLWTSWQPPEGAPIESVTVLTTTPNDVVAPIHVRMPVILSDHAAESAWLDP